VAETRAQEVKKTASKRGKKDEVVDTWSSDEEEGITRRTSKKKPAAPKTMTAMATVLILRTNLR
jgi:U3 small nucleolar ribonucleoprotein component